MSEKAPDRYGTGLTVTRLLRPLTDRQRWRGELNSGQHQVADRTRSSGVVLRQPGDHHREVADASAGHMDERQRWSVAPGCNPGPLGDSEFDSRLIYSVATAIFRAGRLVAMTPDS